MESTVVAVAGEGIRSPVAAVGSNLVERGVGSMAAAVGLHTVDQDKDYIPGIGRNRQTY